MKRPYHLPSLVLLVLAWICVFLYLGLFFRTELIQVPAETGSVSVSRAAVFLEKLLLPEEMFRIWRADGTMPVGVMDRVSILVAAALWIGLATWIGLQGLGVLGLKHDFNRAERLGLACVVGLNVLSSLTFGLAMIGLSSNRWPFLVGLAGLGICFVFLGRRCPTSISDFSWKHSDPSDASLTSVERRGIVLLGIAIFAIGGMTVAGSILPPVEFDVREYHLQAPKEIFQNGKLGFFPHNIYANMPLGTEMHALAWMILDGREDGWFWGALTGKTIIGFFPVLTALMVAGIARRLAGGTALWFAAAAYLSNPGIFEVTRLGLVDVALGCHVAAILCIVVSWQQNRNPTNQNAKSNMPSWSILLGWLMGGAAACKYTAVPMVVLPVLGWWLYNALLPAPRHTRALIAIGLVVAALISGGGWYAKNWVMAGNPVYPLAGAILGGKTLTPEKISQWQQAHRVPPQASSQEVKDAPSDFRLSTFGAAIVRWTLSSHYVGGILMPMALMGILGVWIVPWFDKPYSMFNVASHGMSIDEIRRAMAFMFAWTAWIFLVWFTWTHRLDRFWLPALPCLACMAGIGASANRKGWSLALTGILFAIGMLYAMMGAAAWPYSDNRLLVTLNALRWDERVEAKVPKERSELDNEVAVVQRVPEYQKWLNKTLSREDRVLLVGDAQVFDLQVPLIYSTCFDVSPFETATRDASPEEQRRRLRQLGVTHVVVHWSEINRYRSPGNYGFSDYYSPELFQSLTENQVLESIDWPIENQTAQLFRVLAQESHR